METFTKFAGVDFKPWVISPKKDDKINLERLLKQDRIKKICIHKWVYWRFGVATRIHRICRKCYKKEKNTSDVPKDGGFWIKDDLTKFNYGN